MIHLSLDRFEGDFVVCEQRDGVTREFARSLFPPGAKEGDMFIEHEDGRLEPDPQETMRRKQRLRELQNRLFR